MSRTEPEPCPTCGHYSNGIVQACSGHRGQPQVANSASEPEHECGRGGPHRCTSRCAADVLWDLQCYLESCYLCAKSLEATFAYDHIMKWVEETRKELLDSVPQGPDPSLGEQA
jgi:hypothetical protein